MALIKCKECKKEISDVAKICPHCGYKMKSKKYILRELLDNNNISNYDIIITTCMICIFILSFIDGTYTIKCMEGYSVCASYNYDINNLVSYIFKADFHIIVLFIIVISFLIKILNQFNIFTRIKSFNSKLFYVSSVIYDIILIYVFLYVKTIGVKNGGYVYPAFGAYWVTFIVLLSIGFKIANLINSIKNKNIENKE